MKRRRKLKPQLPINHCTTLCLQVIFSPSKSFFVTVWGQCCNTKWNGMESSSHKTLKKNSNSHFSGRISLAIIFFCFKILKLNLLETEGWRTCTCVRMWGESEFTAAKTSTAEQPTESALIDLDVI